jgi:hypothetical protein
LVRSPAFEQPSLNSVFWNQSPALEHWSLARRSNAKLAGRSQRSHFSSDAGAIPRPPTSNDGIRTSFRWGMSVLTGLPILNKREALEKVGGACWFCKIQQKQVR